MIASKIQKIKRFKLLGNDYLEFGLVYYMNR